MPNLYPTTLSIRDYLFSITIFFAFACLYALPKGQSYLYALLVLSVLYGVFCFFKYKEKNLGLEPIEWGLFLIYTLIIALQYVVHGDEFHLIRIGIPIVLFMFLLPRNKKLIFYAQIGIVLGAIILGFITIQLKIEGVQRVGGYLGGNNSILWAQGALILIILNFWLFFKHRFKNKALHYLTLFSAFMGLITLYYSLSRGIWLSALIVLIYAVFRQRQHLYKFFKVYLSLFVLIVFILVLLVQFTAITDTFTKRINQTRYDITQMEKGNFNTSGGLRIIAWQAAWEAFKAYPIIGTGKNGYREVQEELVKADKANKLILTGSGPKGMTHAHNQYFNSMMRRGIIGIIGLALLLGLPFFYRKQFGQLAPYLVVSYLITGLTEVPFDRISTYFIFLFALIYSSLEQKLLENNTI